MLEQSKREFLPKEKSKWSSIDLRENKEKKKLENSKKSLMLSSNKNLSSKELKETKELSNTV